MNTLMKLRSTSAGLAREMERRAPVSFLQLLFLLADFTVLLVPFGMTDAFGGAHEGWSSYGIPCVATMVTSLFLHGGLRLVSDAADPFGTNIGDEHGTNTIMMQTEHRLFDLLSAKSAPTQQKPLLGMRDFGVGVAWDPGALGLSEDDL